MPFMDEFVNQAAPGISAERLNQPFHVSGAAYDGGTDTLTITVGRGRAWFGDTLVEYTESQQVQVNPVTAETTYYVYLTSAGLVASTTATPAAGQVPLGAVQVGADKNDLTRVDRRGLIEATRTAEQVGAYTQQQVRVRSLWWM